MIFLMLMISAYLYGESSTGNASVLIATTFQYTEVSIVNFHAIPAHNGVCSMDRRGRLSGQCNGSPDGDIGVMRIEGTPKQWIDITVAANDAVDGVTFNPLMASNNNTSASARLNNQGIVEIEIIGNLDLSNATPGLKGLTYTLTVNYQ